jgi:hypothetical protein
MSDQGSTQLSMQMLVSEMRSLSQSFRHATSNLQQVGAGAMRQGGVAAGRIQGYAAAAMAPLSQPGDPYRPGFTGIPTGIQYSGGAIAPIAGGKDALWRNLFTAAGNNEYNKPSNWWRDTLALGGKEFIDVSSQDARRRARRNWSVRGQDLMHSAISTGMAFIPVVGLPLALGYEFLAKPLLMEDSRRTNEYWDWYEKTGGRNIGAKWSRSAEGGWTQVEQKALAEQTQVLYKGSGYKKSQFDDMMAMAEQSGYFKAYDKTSVDQQVTKIKKMMNDAKYVMQTLHTTAEEAVKILSDVEKMGKTGGKVGTHAYTSQLNRASAYSGLSPMQLHEYSVGRSDFFKGMGYSTRNATEMTLQQVREYFSGMTPGKTESLGTHLSIEDSMSRMARSDQNVNFAAMYMFDHKNGELVFSKAKYDKVARGEVSLKDQLEAARGLLGEVDPQLAALISRPGAMAGLLVGAISDQGLPPVSAENLLQRQAVQSLMIEYGLTESPEEFTWKDYSKISDTQKTLFTDWLSRRLGVSASDTGEALQQYFGKGVNVDEEEERAGRAYNGRPDKPLSQRIILGEKGDIDGETALYPKILGRKWYEMRGGGLFGIEKYEAARLIAKEREIREETLNAKNIPMLDGEQRRFDKWMSTTRSKVQKDGRDSGSLYLQKKIRSAQEKGQYALAYSLAREGEDYGLGDIDTFLAEREVVGRADPLAWADILVGTEVSLSGIEHGGTRSGLSRAAVEYAVALAEGDKSRMNKAREEMMTRSQDAWGGEGKVALDKMIAEIHKNTGRVEGVGVIRQFGRGEAEYESMPLEAIARQLEIDSEDRDSKDGKRKETFDISTLYDKQQLDINATVLTYMQHETKAMAEIVSKIGK